MRNLTMLTDLYQMTMMNGYIKAGMPDRIAVFDLFFRRNPGGAAFAVAAGLEQVIDYIKNLRFDEDDIEYLRSLNLFDEKFFDYLRTFRFTGEMYAVPEGTVVFPFEPIVRIKAPIFEAQLIETAMLNIINHQTLIASKAARVCQAAHTDLVMEFGLRRAQGPDAGLYGARAALIAGCGSTSNVLAGKIYGIPVFGTHAHSWVMAFPSEIEAFRAFAKSSPKNCVLLVDTYDVAQGVENAITVAKEMEAAGERLAAIRIDSGDLAKLSKLARRRFDEEGLPYVKISASNDLDEYTIQSLFAQGAPIDSFGVGTKLATCDPQPSLGGVYKLSATRYAGQEEWRPVMKLSEQLYKRTIPGVQHVLRYYDEAGCPMGDEIVVDDLRLSKRRRAVDVIDPLTKYDFSGYESRELLVQVVEDGARLGEMPTLDEARRRCRDALMHLDPATRRFLNPQTYPVGLECGLARYREELARKELDEQDDEE